MNRDPQRFPDDENGNALWQMAEAGDDLSIPREVDFAVLFPTEDDALQFAVHLLRSDQKVSLSSYEENHELPWQVLAHPFMEPSHSNICGFERLLGESAEDFSGRNDGWGCEAQAEH
ncbi:ribonuclease E inhibitor RraB [Rhodanobacter sp. AS-Z3]|uniref:ribonuclease E inhibitor RraB n=1 Tax=Rhodanobacter sp. AS-Z3 TaxID=3031330 RepID=UPI002479284F|nr:ribonuclease E inhibitor RraB [Rhodanobacter sp. AS-Z3]WEN13941.1 ribonuclease E inhibitor RraB [Rhodanobacter sp. AS-Z3]